MTCLGAACTGHARCAPVWEEGVSAATNHTPRVGVLPWSSLRHVSLATVQNNPLPTTSSGSNPTTSRLPVGSAANWRPQRHWTEQGSLGAAPTCCSNTHARGLYRVAGASIAHFCTAPCSCLALRLLTPSLSLLRLAGPLAGLYCRGILWMLAPLAGLLPHHT